MALFQRHTPLRIRLTDVVQHFTSITPTLGDREAKRMTVHLSIREAVASDQVLRVEFRVLPQQGLTI